jgi:hypothetical protein
MTEPRCPHCQTVLPERATFCAACGNRIEGWSVVPEKQQPTILPGGQEPTTNMQPTPSLLKLAALSKKKPEPQSDSTSGPAVPRRFPLWPLLSIAVAAAGGAYYLASRRAPVSPPPPAVATAPAVVAPTPATEAVPAPAAPIAKKSRAHRAHRIDAQPIPTRGVMGSGPLPHKSVKTDSKPLDSRAAAAAVTAPPTDAPVEATPMTDAEMKKEAEAGVDADGVRFVVKAHLSQVHACYERAFKEASPGGRVEIGFAITPSGSPARVRTESNSTGSESLANCLEARVRSWQFPKPVGGDYELIYPFVFSPGS